LTICYLLFTICLLFCGYSPGSFMSERFDKHILKNGMVLLGEPMESVGSVAFGFMLPAGAAQLPDGCCGAGNVITDWIFRGAGDRDSRALCDALDGLGLHRAGSVANSHIIIAAALEAGNMAQALDLYADIILQPSLVEEQFELARQLAVDAVHALDDNPRGKVMLKLREKFYPEPLGRSTAGEIEELQALSAEKTKQIIKNKFNLSETIFSVAGKYDFDAICRQMESLFETDAREHAGPLSLAGKAGLYTHIHNDTLDVITAEFIRLAEGLSDEEVQRAKVGLKSSLILQSESSSSRAGCIGTDYYMLGRVRGLDEIKSKIEETTADSVLQFLRNNRFEDFTVVTIGPKEVSVNR